MDVREKRARKGCCVAGWKTIAFLCTLGILLIAAAVTLYETKVLDRYIQRKINEKLVLGPDSEGYAQWLNPTVPIHMQYFIFDVVNPEEVLQGKKPYVFQRGPFSYREHRHKRNVTWNTSYASVTYNQEMYFVFDPSTSCSSCDPHVFEVTTINIPLVTLAEAVRNLPFFVKEFIGVVIFEHYKEKIFIKRRVHDLLWGYKDPLFAEYAKLRSEAPDIFRKHLPDIPPIVALQKNDTYGGVTSVRTGAKDIKQLVEWIEWKGQSILTVWNSTYANMINGTDGSEFSPDTSPDDTLYVFVTMLCRSLYLTHSANSRLWGIDALQFTVPKEEFLNGTTNPDNEGFCVERCYPSGILDIGVCQPPSPVKIPLFVSAPHFYLGDPSLHEEIGGLSPNKEEHGTYLNVEPHTGISIKGSKRLQINVKVEAVRGIVETGGISSLFFPVMYVNESVALDSASVDKLKSEVLSKFVIVHALELGMVILGGLLVLVAIIVITRLIIFKRKQKKLKLVSVLNGSSEDTPLLWS